MKPVRLSAIAAAMAVLAVGAAGCSTSSEAEASSDTSTSAEPEQTRLEAAYEACEDEDRDNTVSVEDEGETILVDTGSEYGDPSGLMCVMEELDVSSALDSQFWSTTALMGVQEEEEDGLEYRWSYHPDNGANLIITEVTE